jgi:hypothetical protein
MPDGRQHYAHIEGKLVGAALLEEVPLEEHAGSSDKLRQSSGASPNLRPEHLVVSQPIDYQSPFRQRSQLIGQLPLIFPTVFDDQRTD